MNDDLKKVIKELIEVANADKGDYFILCQAIALLLPAGLLEQLAQLHKGPIYDGDVISKSARDELMNLGLAIRVCYKSEQGYTGTPYIAHTIVNYKK